MASEVVGGGGGRSGGMGRMGGGGVGGGIDGRGWVLRHQLQVVVIWHEIQMKLICSTQVIVKNHRVWQKCTS